MTKNQRADLGSVLLQRVALPGIVYTVREIAAWWGTPPQAVSQFEERALRKLRNHLHPKDRALLRSIFESMTEERQIALRPGSVRTLGEL